MTEVFSLDPLIMRRPLTIDYLHSYGEHSKYFTGLAEGKIYAARCPECGRTWLPPRRDCGECLAKTEWFEAPLEGTVHTFSTAHFSGESFLKEVPFTLIYVELEGIDTVLLARIRDVEREKVHIGMKVKARFKRLPEWNAADLYFVPA